MKKNILKYPGMKKAVLIGLLLGVVIGAAFYFTTSEITTAVIAFLIVSIGLAVYSYARLRYKEALEIKKMETAFPDFLELTATNLRAGMTTDTALLLSARKEFAPLDKEIIKLGKELLTGKEIAEAMLNMARRINSEKITKIIDLLVSGITSGGNIAVLIEETATNMRQRNFIEKRAASNVLMYTIFILFASAIGAPILFGLSSVLVDVLTSILSTIPEVEVNVGLPFSLTKISISTQFITYFSFIFLIVTNIIGSLVVGLVNKGEERAGLTFILPLITTSIIVFIIIRKVMLGYFSGVFG